MPDAFGTIPAPGTTVVAEVKPGDVLASYSPPPLIKGGTIKTSQTTPAGGGAAVPTGIVRAGQALDYEAATKKYIITVAGTAAVGVLLQDVDTSKGDVLGNIIMSGTLKAERVIGFGAVRDAAGFVTTTGNIAGLGSRTINRSAEAGLLGDYIRF
jgi:hypothetical protein